MTERVKLITEHLSGNYSVSDLARRHGVSRLSVYKWLKRFARSQQQQALEAFRREYNQERPHEALAQRVPAELYAPSPRPYPKRLPAPREYPETWMVRQVRPGGQMKWAGENVTVTKALSGERVGLQPQGDGIWAVWFESLELGTFDERHGRIRRHKHLPMRVGKESQP